MKGLRNMPESLETVNSDRFVPSAIILENNSSMTS